MTETIIQWAALALAAAGLALMLRSDVAFIRNGTQRTQAKVVRHHRMRDDGATMYAAIMLVADGRPGAARGYIEVRDSLYTPFPKPVIGELVEVVHPAGLPAKARIPHPWFRGLVYGLLGYVLVVVGLKVLGLG